MRRLLTLAAVAATLTLAACSDQNPTEPSAPTPDALTTSCRPVPFPVIRVSALILKVFPAGKLRIEALARAGLITLLWDTCKRAPAQRAAISFIDFMNANSTRLIGTQDQRNTLINLILNGVGIPGSVPPTASADFGVGFFDPGSDQALVVKTASKVALTEIPPHAFPQPMVIKVARKPDNENLTNFAVNPLPRTPFAEPRVLNVASNWENRTLRNFAGNQFPPAWDYDAIRSDGATSNADHVLQNGNLAAVVFCLLNSDFVTYPENRRIGHNPVPGAPGFPFEILDPIDLVNERPDLAAGLDCPNLAPNTAVIGGFGRGVPGLANAAWRTAGRYLGPLARAIFLPQPLDATTMGTLPPPIGGRAPSLSLFKTVEVSSSPGVISNGTLSLGVNPAGHLIFEDGEGSRFFGLRYLPTNAEAVGLAFLNEGWGIAHPGSEVSGYVSDEFPAPAGLSVESFARTTTQATSIVRVGGTFRVTHRFRPLTATPNLYEVHVTVENTSDAPLSGVKYRRVLDWDIEPTPFDEFVTIAGTGTNVPAMFATNNGFMTPDPLVPPGPIGFGTPDHTADFFDKGPFDHGAVFDLTLSTIFPGGTNTFVFYYGAAANKSAAKTLLRSVGSSVVSIARPNVSPFDGTPNTFVMGWSGIGGVPLEVAQMEPPPPPLGLRAPALPSSSRVAKPNPRNLTRMRPDSRR